MSESDFLEGVHDSEASSGLPKRFDWGRVEAECLDRWTREPARGSAEGEPFSMVVPPPNITGRLHMGHALNLTIQDVAARYRRQEGRDVLWIPGVDHAGIAAQNVVEKQLRAEGVDFKSLGREAFVDRVWRWKESIGSGILDQIRHLGASLSWDHERFTMDPGFSLAVREVFVRLYEDGALYRAERMIHWCPRCLTALSDVEVTHLDREGELSFVRYVAGDRPEDFLVVATTRPETVVADLALAVHPEDERYAGWVGRQVKVPMTGRTIPVVADAAVDPAFGTGVLKITPSHSMVDFEIGQRHGLGTLSVIDERGVMNAMAGPLSGLPREKARLRAMEVLESDENLVRREPHKNAIGVCYRCQTEVEPRLSLQWFVRMAPLAARAREAVSSGEIQFFPETWQKTYFEWIDNIRDWCVSRQIWWGHRIPAWTCQDCHHLSVLREDPEVCPRCGGVNLVRDPDVLDTWFSSALWPFATMGWPEETPDLRRFYPTHLLVTGFDILFFWVARMIMMGLYLTGKVPFRDVYIHALVRDEFGQKMTKSRGNVVDPLELMERFGTDAFRLSLVLLATPGRDIRLAVERVEAARNFVSKLWSAFRYISLAVPPGTSPLDDPAACRGIANRWILSELARLESAYREAMESYRYDEGALLVYRFTWSLFCDWYLEATKGDFEREAADPLRIETARTLVTVGSTLLDLAHPIMPFVTEELSRLLKFSNRCAGRGALPPLAGRLPEGGGLAFDRIRTIVGSVRQTRSVMKIPPTQEIPAALVLESPSAGDPEELWPFIERLGRLSRSGEIDLKGLRAPFRDGYLVLGLEGLVDYSREADRLEKEIQKIGEKIAEVAGRLGREDFVRKAPPEVVEKDRTLVGTLEEDRQGLTVALAQLRAFLGETS
ncbi:MAG: valine--tRNA ligase [Nitrospirae bacterium]|nr:valine--tRNA ligase [Nitrospirota bacterium]MCL5285635.1 valine--tRNA ligase [Nitrospirota bacterium]